MRCICILQSPPPFTTLNSNLIYDIKSYLIYRAAFCISNNFKLSNINDTLSLTVCIYVCLFVFLIEIDCSMNVQYDMQTFAEMSHAKHWIA